MSAIIDLWRGDILGKMLILMLISILAFILCFPFMLIHEAERWEEFIKVNDCKLSERVAPSYAIGTAINANGSIGIVNVSTPEKLGYLCKDGVTYWK